MDSTDAYLVARCLMLAESLRGLDDLVGDARADALRDAADLLAEVLTEAGADAPDAS